VVRVELELLDLKVGKERLDSLDRRVLPDLLDRMEILAGLEPLVLLD